MLEIIAIFVGIGTVIANYLIAHYNVGKNRIIYEIEEIRVQSHSDFKTLNDKLNIGKHTLLNTYQDVRNYANTIYVLGKVKV